MARNVFQESACDAAFDDIGNLIDEELAEIPRKYRDVLILCDLEGQTPREAAGRLSVPNGTVSSRLARGRKLLQRRLVARGISIGALSLAIVLSQLGRAAPALPQRIVDKTVEGTRKQGTGSDRVASLVVNLKRQLMLAKINGWLCLFGFAIVAAAAGPAEVVSLVGQARGETILKDDFEDGSVQDGQPAIWTTEFANLSVEGGSLIISGPNVPAATPSIADLSDVSVQVQTRLLEGEAVGVAARLTPNGPVKNYYAFLTQDEVGIALGGVMQTLHSSPVTFDTTTEDVILQLDVIGDTITYWAWPADEPRPLAPLGSVTDQTLTSGAVGLWAASQGLSNQTTGRGAFRYVEVANSAIVPEPSTAILASLAAFAIGGWCCFKKVQL